MKICQPWSNRAFDAWARAEPCFGTDLGQHVWEEFWRRVRRARRAYAGGIAVAGLAAGSVVGVAAATVARHPFDEMAWNLAGYASVLPFATVWKWLLRITVAPGLFRPAQMAARAIYVVAHPAVLVASPWLPGGPWWGLVAAVITAAPWLASAVIETSRRVPDYPDRWRRFTAG